MVELLKYNNKIIKIIEIIRIIIDAMKFLFLVSSLYLVIENILTNIGINNNNIIII